MFNLALIGFLASYTFLLSSCGEKESPTPQLQTVTFSIKSFDFQMPTPADGRLSAVSFWNHIFKNEAVLEIINLETQQQTKVTYNPNNFSEAFSVSLPTGNYRYKSIVEGGVFESFLPFFVEGEFSVTNQTTDVILEADTDYGLITLKNNFVKSATISASTAPTKDLTLSPDQQYRYTYIKSGTQASLKIIDSIFENELSRTIDVVKKRHINFILERSNGGINVLDLIIGPFEYEEVILPIGERRINMTSDELK
ncbi:hypothetical protein ACFFF3_12830 [Mongoliitalea lutea]